MKYLLNIIGIARYNKIHYTEGDKDKRISYCKNRGLIYAMDIGMLLIPRKVHTKTESSISKK